MVRITATSRRLLRDLGFQGFRVWGFGFTGYGVGGRVEGSGFRLYSVGSRG